MLLYLSHTLHGSSELSCIILESSLATVDPIRTSFLNIKKTLNATSFLSPSPSFSISFPFTRVPWKEEKDWHCGLDQGDFFQSPLGSGVTQWEPNADINNLSHHHHHPWRGHVCTATHQEFWGTTWKRGGVDSNWWLKPDHPWIGSETRRILGCPLECFYTLDVIKYVRCSVSCRSD